MEKFTTLIELVDRFSDEGKCRQHLEKLLWNDKPICPFCKKDKIYKYASRGLFKCSDCKKQFSATVGTIFHGSHIPLRKWFIAIYLFTSNKKGISAHQLSRSIKTTVKTAWFMLQRIRF